MRLPGGGYGACQVTGVDRERIAVYALAWHSPDPPTLASLDGVGPLVLGHHAYDSEPAHTTVGRAEPVPAGVVWLGNLPVPAGLAAAPNSYSSWQFLPMVVAGRRRWEHDLPEAAKQAYLAVRGSGPVEVDFGAGPAMEFPAGSVLDLAGTGRLRVPAGGPVRWSALDQLPGQTTLAWSGPDRGLVAALTERPIIDTLFWEDAPSEVDLSGTGLVSARLTGAAVRQVRLPRRMQSLTLADAPQVRTVVAADDGRWLGLTVETRQPGVPLPAGLAGVREVEIEGGGVISVAALRALPELDTIRLTWRGAPGQLTDAGALADLPRLAVIELVDAYGFDAGTLPDLPALAYLDIRGLRRSVVAALKARYRGTGVALTTSGAKSDTWLAANLTNPFRDWVDDDTQGGTAACKAYAEAVRALDKLPAAGEVERILHTLVDRLNEIGVKYGFIDTLRRDEAGAAFVELAARANVPADVADAWFDDWHDF
jgi:hypothetical protein